MGRIGRGGASCPRALFRVWHGRRYVFDVVFVVRCRSVEGRREDKKAP